MKWFGWSGVRTRAGMTLIEVVCGIALMATLLVLILQVFRTHSAQIRNARERMIAITLADQLLQQWTEQGGIPAAGQQDQIGNFPQWQWKVSSVPATSELWSWGGGIARLEIIDTSRVTAPRRLASVDVVVPLKKGDAR